MYSLKVLFFPRAYHSYPILVFFSTNHSTATSTRAMRKPAFKSEYTENRNSLALEATRSVAASVMFPLKGPLARYSVKRAAMLFIMKNMIKMLIFSL